MTYNELKTLSTQLDLNRSVQVGKHLFVDNAQQTIKSLFLTYEGVKDSKQRERYKYYLSLIEIILNKCR